MSSQKKHWETPLEESYLYYKEELRKKEQEIKQLKESNKIIKDLEGRIKALETERNILQDRLLTLEGELGVVKSRPVEKRKRDVRKETYRARISSINACDGKRSLLVFGSSV